MKLPVFDNHYCEQCVAFKITTYLANQQFTMQDHRKKRKAPGLNDEDYYFTADGFMVFTAAYHLKRGYCCKNGCRHCPYGFKKVRN